MSPLRAAIVLILAGVSSSALAEQITCESHGDRAEACGTVARGSTVRVLRQLSNAACVEGRTWGADHDSIWVSGGCRAVFDVQPPYNQTADSASERSPEWQRGYEDGQHGRFDRRDDSQGYRAGFHAGKDSARNAPPADDRDERDNDNEDQPAPDDRDPRGARPEQPHFEDAPPPRDEDSDDRPPPPPPRDTDEQQPRGANAERARASAGRACVDQVVADQSLRRNDVAVTDVRWAGRGTFVVSLDAPDGQLTCTVDRDGNIQSIDQR